MARKIKYKDGYKYQLTEDYTEQVAIQPDQPVQQRFLSLTTDGLLTVRVGYAWDGPSGPTVDTRNFMRGSLIHDALYQLMRHQDLPDTARKEADLELRRICREDGMWLVRAWWVYVAVRWWAKGSASAESRKQVLTAP